MFNITDAIYDNKGNVLYERTSDNGNATRTLDAIGRTFADAARLVVTMTRDGKAYRSSVYDWDDKADMFVLVG